MSVNRHNDDDRKLWAADGESIIAASLKFFEIERRMTVIVSPEIVVLSS
jgi:hypothetical protein